MPAADIADFFGIELLKLCMIDRKVYVHMFTKNENQVVEYDCPGSEFSLQSWAFFSINKCLSLSFKFFSCVKLSFICVIIYILLL